MCRLDPVQPCGHCGLVNWGEEELEAPCTVVLPSALVCTSFAWRACSTELDDGSICPGQLQVDGKEHALLRQTGTLAISHEVLYHWIDRLATGHPDTWTSSWLLTLLHDRHRTDDQKRRLFELKQLWSNATLDFLQLQCIDYDAGFRCSCWQGVSQCKKNAWLFGS